MSDRSPAFYAACIITAACLLIAALLAFFGPDPAPQSITRLLDALIYIAIAGALTIFGLLGYRSDRKPPEPG
jgi:hypothetical protein